MKKLATFLTACLLFVVASSNAQTCCDANGAGTTVAPQIQTGFYSTSQIAVNQNTPAPVLSVNASADLPTVEYIITKRNTPALNDQGTPDTTGGGGDVVIGSDVDGIFMPDDLGRYGVTLNAGDTFDLTAVGYDINVIKNLADSLLNGYSGAQPCCNFMVVISNALQQPAIAGFCDSMNNAGIMGGADVNGMNEVLTIFDVFSTGQTSRESLISTLQIINGAGGFISTDCGGTGTSNFLPYGINKNATYGYDREGTIAVQKLSDVSLFMLYPNPSNGSRVNVRFSTSKEVDLTINLVDGLGRRIHSQTLGSVSGDFYTGIPVENLAAGMYFVELTDGHNSQTHKLMIK